MPTTRAQRAGASPHGVPAPRASAANIAGKAVVFDATVAAVSHFQNAGDAALQRNAPLHPALIPAPVAYREVKGSLILKGGPGIAAPPELTPAIHLLAEYWKINPGSGSHIVFRIDTHAVKQPEGYRMHIRPDQAVVSVRDADGAFRAVQTLRQLARTSDGTIQLPACDIEDAPRFHYRGMHLDVSRHFFSVDFVKGFIDSLALYKFNTFHWHLTDDQGWRIEIKKYPRLQSEAAWRNETLIGHKKELPHRFGGKRYGGFYTQEEVRQVVAYAASRGIEVIPEIEMPGHAQAALTAYPHLGCTGGPYQTATFWGVFDDVFCAGKDSTFLFLEDVLEEVLPLFPSQYIHIGGDECPKTRWNACPACKKRMADENLPDADALQSYFVRRIGKWLNARGRKLIGWDEILEGGLAPGATVMSWRGVEGATAAASQGHRVIMTPEDELYFDHYTSLYDDEPVAAGGYTPLKEVYAWEPPMPALIAGVQGQLWSEYLPTEKQALYMLYPRMLALAETAWSPVSGKSWTYFLARLQRKDPALVPDEIVMHTQTPHPGTIRVSLEGIGKIAWRLDGGPVKIYSAPIDVRKSAVLEAWRAENPSGRKLRRELTVHLGTGAQIRLHQLPNTKYNAAAQTLVNGVAGTHRYNDGQWLGFSARDLDAVVDLGAKKWIRRVGVNILNYHWQRMWEPAVFQVLISTDGKNFTQIAETDSFPVNGINAIRLPVAPVEARFVKFIARHKGVIPPGEYGAGGNSMLLADELMIE
ncbi:family 20 glycosylhydrolase [Chitinophaga caseinilytica]|uniref:glycoside hydrolase family 20 protein n=1 Tax=Chitinophaga caseinilytica TaxID=2267521 RepID=UPI003C2EBD3E